MEVERGGEGMEKKEGERKGLEIKKKKGQWRQVGKIGRRATRR